MPSSDRDDLCSAKRKNVTRLAIKVAVFVVFLEIFARMGAAVYPVWYEKALRSAGKDKIKYVFIGSSQTAAAISTPEFMQQIDPGSLQGAAALNLGRGYSTLVGQFFGIKKLAAVIPGGLKDVTVFFEAMNGMPDMSLWRDPWVNSKNPELLADTISFKDLAGFWRLRGVACDQKLSVTVAMVSEAYKKKGAGSIVMEKGENYLRNKGMLAPLAATDLSSAGGILTDSSKLKAVRTLAVEITEKNIASQKHILIRQGEEPVLKSLNDFISSNGGRLILFTIPYSSVLAKSYSTDISAQNRKTVSKLLADWNIQLLSPTISTTDDDFPDLWHLRRSRSGEFSRGLAATYNDLLNRERKNRF
jgi:hypothetical protein